MKAQTHMSRIRLAVPLVLVLAGVTAGAAAAQPAPEPARGTLSAAAAVFRPLAQEFRDLYGTQVPVVAQLDWPIGRHLAVFAGVRHLRSSGETIPVSQQETREPERFAIRFRSTSLRLGGLLLVPRGPWSVSAGAGAVYCRYSERWPDAGFNERDDGTGFIVQAGVTRAFARRWSALGRVEYSYGPRTKPAAGSDVVTRVNLGGIDVTAGIGFRF
jgi:hypothetical protein